MSPDDVKKLIEDGVEGAEAIISGEGCNLEATVISDVPYSRSPLWTCINTVLITDQTLMI